MTRVGDHRRIAALLVGVCVWFAHTSAQAWDRVDVRRYEEGRALVETFECNRCHAGTGLADAPQKKHCVGCHQDILAGTFKASPDILATWQETIVHLTEVPSLAAMDVRFTQAWLRGFLLEPHDLRPNMAASMPRLDMTPAQARRIAAYFIPERAAPEAPKGDTAIGLTLLATRGCGTCHRFTGLEPPLPPSPIPVQLDVDALKRGMHLAPDLRHTRARFQPDALARWLRDPSAIKPNSAMPTLPLTEAEAEHLAAAIWTAPLTTPTPAPMPPRLPMLERPVSFDEVSRAAFRKVCWHCHSEPDLADGDGGPGNTGGLGFVGRGLSFAFYSSIAAGSLDDAGQPRSIFAPMPDGTPRLIAVLRARQSEERGVVVPGLRGMPLGLPALSPEEIQLIETWIAQGRPR